MSNEETPDLLKILLSKKFAIVFSLDTTLEFDSAFQIMFLHVDFHRDHVLDLRLHLEGLLLLYNQVPPKSLNTTLKTFQSQKNEVTRYTVEMTSARTPKIWFYDLYIHSQNEIASS